MSKEPRVNLDRLVSQIVLDATLLRWFSYNGRRDAVWPRSPYNALGPRTPRAKSWTS